MREIKFKSRYVLGEGYPAVHEFEGKCVLFTKKLDFVLLKYPKEFFEIIPKERPKYRLILEQVGKKK